MQRRGRSRQVSSVALARQASEERAAQQWGITEKLNTHEPLPPTPSTQLAWPTRTITEAVKSRETRGADLSSNLVSAPPLPSPSPPPSNIIDLTGPGHVSLQSEHKSVTYIYPPSVSSSPAASLVATPTLSDSHASDSYFSPNTPEEWSAPPSITLLDQLHMAYALDDLPLAKILLLKITHDIQDITSRTDPRLDLVRPEDFDVAFLPRGGLMSPEDELRLAEQQEKERKRLQKEAAEARCFREGIEREKREREEKERARKEEIERAERERAWESWVEGVWGNAKREMDEVRQLKELAKARQVESEKESRCQDEERRRVTAERRRTTPKCPVSIPRISYAHLSTTRPPCPSPSSSSDSPQLLYALPHIPKLSTQPRRIARTTGTLLRKSTPSSSGLVCLASESLNEKSDVTKLPTLVSLREVITAMRGELFPLESPPVGPEKRDRSQHILHARRRSEDLDLVPERRRSKTPNPLSHKSKSNSISMTTSVMMQQKIEAALLAELLYSDGQVGTDRLQCRRRDKAKAKDKAVVVSRTNSSISVMSKLTCTACSSSPVSPSVISSSSGVSRSGSWLSFISSSSASSTSTQLTTPSASTSGSPPATKSSIRPGSVFSTWLKGAMSSLPEEKCSCDVMGSPRTYNTPRRARCRLVPVAKDASPLPLDLSSSPVSVDNRAVVESHSSTAGSSLASSITSHPLLRSMTHFLDAAKSFQSAYMHATMFASISSVSNVSTYGNEWDREYKNEQESEQARAIGNQDKQRLRPVGCRVEKNEAAFILSAVKKDGQQPSDADRVTIPSGFRPKIKLPELFPADDSVQYIPLISPYPYNLEHPPQTVLPNPLPFTIHFKPQPSLTGSPLRRWTAEQIQSRSSSKRRLVSPPRYGPNGFRQSRRASTPPMISQPIPRPRFVGNPVYLRLKALENCTGIPVTDTHVVELLEEGVSIKVGTLSCGREKVLGTAFEEVGRSRLSVDFACIQQAVHHRATLPINPTVTWWHRKDDSNGARWEDGSVRRGRSVVKG